MIQEDLTIKIIDIGYGKELKGTKGDGYNRTQLGTPGYVAPEIVAGRPY